MTDLLGIKFWLPKDGFVITIEEMKKAGLRVTRYPAYIKQVQFGTSK